MPPSSYSFSVPATVQEPEPTGVPQLDFILGGGLLPGSLVIILGPPGSGKTTLATQIAFAAARREQNALILTSLSESTSKLIAYMRSYRFFAPELLGNRVNVFSVQQFLEQEGKTMGQDIVTSVRQTQARLVVLDGFQSIREEEEQMGGSRRFLYTLGNRLSLLGTTTLITTEADPRDTLLYPEMTTGDVLIALHTTPQGRSVARDIEVIKLRGRASVLGRHSTRISAAGLEVFPRLESFVPHAVVEPQLPQVDTIAPDERATFGLKELDDLLGGGLTRSTSTLLTGNLGTAKTFLALQFALAGVQNGEAAVFLGFRETERQLLQKTAPFRMGELLRAALTPGGGLTLRRWEPIEVDPDRIALDTLRTLERTKARRLVIDSIIELERAVTERSGKERVPNFLAALLAALRERDVTLLAVKEIAKLPSPSAQLDFPASEFSVLAENVLLAQQIAVQNCLHRVFSVLKMRFSAHDYSLREFRITPPAGLHVLRPDESGLSFVPTSTGRQQNADDSSPSGYPLESAEGL